MVKEGGEGQIVVLGEGSGSGEWGQLACVKSS